MQAPPFSCKGTLLLTSLPSSSTPTPYWWVSFCPSHCFQDLLLQSKEILTYLLYQHFPCSKQEPLHLHLLLPITSLRVNRKPPPASPFQYFYSKPNLQFSLLSNLPLPHSPGLLPRLPVLLVPPMGFFDASPTYFSTIMLFPSISSHCCLGPLFTFTFRSHFIELLSTLNDLPRKIHLSWLPFPFSSKLQGIFQKN